MDPALPRSLRTTGAVEAALVTRWPPPTQHTRAGTVETARNGDITLVTGNGRRIARGNFFEDYVATLNHPARSPSAARVPVSEPHVRALTVFDVDGNVLYRYTRNARTGVWTGSRP